MNYSIAFEPLYFAKIIEKGFADIDMSESYVHFIKKEEEHFKGNYLNPFCPYPGRRKN